MHLSPKNYSPTFVTSFLSDKLENVLNIDDGGQESGDGESMPFDNDFVKATSSTEKHVFFSKEVAVREIPSLFSYDDSEKSAIWFCGQDMLAFRQARAQLVQRVDAGEDLDLTGIENCTRRGLIKSYKHRMRARKVVLINQDSNDEYGIAELYINATVRSKMIANTRGMLLDRDIREYLTNMRSYRRKSYNHSRRNKTPSSPRQRRISSSSRSSLSPIRRDGTLPRRSLGRERRSSLSPKRDGTSPRRSLGREELQNALLTVRRLGITELSTDAAILPL